MSPAEVTPGTPDYAAIKARQRAAWQAGDYARIGTTLQIVGEELAEAMNLHPHSTVLDVAAGNGNATLAFARRWNKVTSTDFVASLLECGRARAEAEGLPVAFRIADAEALPYDDASFDAVVSTFGVMFTPDQRQALRELVRVCRRGGCIGLANWTPHGFIGQLFETIARRVPPPAGVPSPATWGTEQWISANFGDVAISAVVNTKTFIFRYASPDHFIDVFSAYYGPLHTAFLALDCPGKAALDDDLRGLVATFNQAIDGSVHVPAEYLEIVIEKA